MRWVLDFSRNECPRKGGKAGGEDHLSSVLCVCSLRQFHVERGNEFLIMVVSYQASFLCISMSMSAVYFHTKLPQFLPGTTMLSLLVSGKHHALHR